MRKQRAPGADRLFKARRVAAKELRLSTDDWRVKRYAVFMVAHDTLQAKLATGANINIDGLMKLDAAMAEIRASVPQEPVRVELEIVKGIVGICPSCKAEIRPYEPPPDPPPSAPTPPPPSDTQPEPSKPKQPKPSNVVELRPHPPGIHDAPSARMAVHQEPWRGHVDAASDPVPDWGAAHSLPPTPPECFPK